MQKKLNTELIEQGYTFPRSIRLLTSRDFQAVFRDNKIRSSDNMWKLLARQNNLPHARLGMAISKRVIKTSVDRNRLKRVVRESFRHHQQKLAGLDIVVMCRDGSRQANNGELFDSLHKHWERVSERA